MGLKPDAPKAPDPTKTANTQLGYSKDAAQSTINMNSLDRNGPFGSSTFTRDANGNVTGQNVSLSSLLQGGSDATQNAFTANAGNLPTGPINWDSTTVPSIVSSNYANYENLVAPQRAQQQKQLDTTLSDRGIPIGSEIYDDAQGNLNNSFNLADSNTAASFLNAAPGQQAQLISNQTNMQNQPYQTAGLNLGLLQGLGSLNSAAPQGSASVGAPDYSGLVNNNYAQQMQQYNNQMTGLGNLAGAGLGLLTAPLTGGASLIPSVAGAAAPQGYSLSNTLLGKGFGSVANSASSLWNSAAPGYSGALTY